MNQKKLKMKFIFSFLLFSCFTVVEAQDTLTYSTAEIIYGRKDGMALTLIKLTPKKDAKRKAIVSLVSGNWVSNYSMAGRYISKSLYLVNNGFTVFFVIHGSQPRYAINDELEDIKRAVRFVRFNAKNYEIDGTHIGISGSSSGGHLSLMAALSDDNIKPNSQDPVDKISSKIQAAAIFFPPTDFINWGGENTKTDVDRLRKTVAAAFDFKFMSDSTGMYEHVRGEENLKKMAADNSPINKVTGDDPPILIFHGDADPIVPLQQSQTLIKRLNDAGVINELIIKKAGVHGWKNDAAEEKKILQWFDRFLK